MRASAAERRHACYFRAGDHPAFTLDAEEPRGVQIPIDHFIVVMQENRSFDHYFQMLPQRGQVDVDVAPDTFANPAVEPDPNAPIDMVPGVTIYHETEYCKRDIEHGWNGAHRQYGEGKWTASSFPVTARPA